MKTGDSFALEFRWTVNEDSSFPSTTRIRLFAPDGEMYFDTFDLPSSDEERSSLLKTVSSITSTSPQGDSLLTTALTLCSLLTSWMRTVPRTSDS